MEASALGYFDHNATTPMRARARQVWLETAERHWHNPSGLYREAGAAKRLLEDCREAVADYFDVDDPERVVFTSGATEANNAVMRHLSLAVRGSLAISGIEHPSVAAAASTYFGNERLYPWSVDAPTGQVEVAALEEMVRRGGLGAVTIMAANNETGALQPWEAVADLCRQAGLPLHIDAAQWIGKCPPGRLAASAYLSGSAHKFGGGKGVGFLLLPPGDGAAFHAQVGGPQEQGRRAGTENLPAIAAMVEALQELESDRLTALAEGRAKERDAFEARVMETLDVRILARAGTRLWNTSLLVLPWGRNVKWLARLSQRGFAVSTGSACSAGKGNPSATMAAMGLDFEEMGRVLRVSGGPETRSEDWERLADALLEVAAEWRAEA